MAVCAAYDMYMQGSGNHDELSKLQVEKCCAVLLAVLTAVPHAEQSADMNLPDADNYHCDCVHDSSCQLKAGYSARTSLGAAEC